uniref:Serine and arginine rich splicing factor 3 n=1 Tax=Rousettus aegyptiacus TaxID=9407 RepID=A0A7J8KHA8_ROUAE|nr:serine and arginine rich splicing factor 3 [Rousettus aegyptiacus]
MHRDSCPLDCKVYVGNLGNNGNKTELERAFGYYGPLRSVWVARNPPGFAFVEFEDPRDAADAVRELDGRSFSRSRSRSLSRDRRRERSLSRERNHKPSRSFSRSRSRSRSNERK